MGITWDDMREDLDKDHKDLRWVALLTGIMLGIVSGYIIWFILQT